MQNLGGQQAGRQADRQAGKGGAGSRQAGRQGALDSDDFLERSSHPPAARHAVKRRTDVAVGYHGAVHGRHGAVEWHYLQIANVVRSHVPLA